MTDDMERRFEVFVQRSAGSYNAPGEVPREEMWNAVVAARAAARAAAVSRRRLAWKITALAATLAIGVAIGRYGVAGRPSPDRQSGLAPNPAIYAVAATQHLGRAEALLMSYGNPALDPYADSTITRWTRDLLSSTRLLLDSPAAADPVQRKLFEDLERILVQMIQKSPAESDADARAIVERSLTRTNMLTRLRTTQPAAFTSGS